jgi:epoxyqueuosine reductase QueG
LKLLSEMAAFVKQAAHDAGFELAGIAPVAQFPELSHFPEWIAAGHAGEMQYLEKRDEAGNLKRASLRSAAPWARSVIVCAINYNTAHPYSTHKRKVPSKDGSHVTLGVKRIITTRCCADCERSKTASGK